MSAKRLAALVVPVLVLISSAWAQRNELSATVGRTFVSTETVPSTGYPVHFGNPVSFAFDYTRYFKSYKIFGFSAEVPVAIYPHMNLNYYPGNIPANVGAMFITPSLRVNMFSADSVSPCGDTSRCHRAPGRWPRFCWPHLRRSKTRPPWSLWATAGWSSVRVFFN